MSISWRAKSKIDQKTRFSHFSRNETILNIAVPLSVLLVAAKYCTQRTPGGKCCEFPFVYESHSYTTCAVGGLSEKPWCSTTPNFDRDGQWDHCQGMGVQKLEFVTVCCLWGNGSGWLLTEAFRGMTRLSRITSPSLFQSTCWWKVYSVWVKAIAIFYLAPHLLIYVTY